MTIKTEAGMSRDSLIQINRDPEGGYRLTARMTVDLPREEVFDFFADANQLERITPEWLNFKILTERPIHMRAGLLLDYKIRLHAIPIKWRTEISAWNPPFRFVDQQLKGPYKRWHHEHTFEEVDGKTIVVDNVHYIPRGGSLIHRFMVKPDLEKIFRFRHDRLTEIFAEKIAGNAREEIQPTHPPVLLAQGQSETFSELNSR